MQTNNLADLSGQTLDNYQIEKLLVQRKFSALYLAHDDGGDPVFLEVLAVTAGSDPDLDGRFRRRMRTLAQIKHPNIASVHTVDHTPDNHSYAAIQYVEGVTLAEKLSEWRESGHSLTIRQALTLVRHLADALTAVHPAGIIHHDLRPENIILRHDAPFLIDLGIPPITESVESTTRVERLDYASPEQRQGKTVSGRSNIYSLGIILYELLAGHRPEIPISSWDIFERSTLPKEVPLEEARPGLTVETYDLVKMCLWRQEWSRFDTANNLVKAIDAALLAEEEKKLQPETSLRFPLWQMGAVLVGLIVVIGGGFLIARRETPGDIHTPLAATATTNASISPAITQSATPQPDSLSAPTSAQTPSSTAEVAISLIAPSPGFEFNADDTILFDWYWPGDLQPDQEFFVYLQLDDETQPIGSVDSPILGSQYRLSVEIMTLNLPAGTYQWFVTLETVLADTALLHSEQQSFSVQAATPTATSTPTTTSVANEATLTPTQPAACVPSPPPEWIEYTVQSGDFLFNLAFQTGITVARVQEVNCLTDPIIGAGMKLWLPSWPATQTPTPFPTSSAPTAKPPKPGATKTPPPPP